MRQDFFQLVLSAQLAQKKLKILQLFIIQVVDHRFNLEQKIGTKSPCAGSICSGPIPCLFFQVKIDLWSVCNDILEVIHCLLFCNAHRSPQITTYPVHNRLSCRDKQSFFDVVLIHPLPSLMAPSLHLAHRILPSMPIAHPG